MGTPKIPNRRTSKRILKPVIEKKRRDRINQRLDELRTLLLDISPDTRLQNPRLEKAEILELTVEYIRKRTSNKKEIKDFNKDWSDTVAPAMLAGKPCLPHISLHDPAKLKVSSPLYTAGFRECISRLASFIECAEPSQRESFIQGLRHHLDSHSARIPGHPWVSGTSEPFSYANSHQLYPQSFVLHHPHAPGQALSHPYPSPPYSLSPPPSPCYSSTSPPFSTSPTYLSVPCHFPFPPSVSPLSSDSCSPSSSFTTSTPAVAVVTTLKHTALQHTVKTASPTPLRTVAPTFTSCPTQRTLRRTLFQNQQHNLWRPW